MGTGKGGSCDACGTGNLPGGGGAGVGGLPSHPATGRWEERSVFEGRNGTRDENGFDSLWTSSCFSPTLPVFPPTLFLGLEAEDQSIRSSVPFVEISALCCRRPMKTGGRRDLIYCEERGRFALAQRGQKGVPCTQPSEGVHVCAGACMRLCARVPGHTHVRVFGRIGEQAVVS